MFFVLIPSILVLILRISTKKERYMTLETESVPTSALREGDKIIKHGCLMQLGPINESQAHKPNQYGKCLYSYAKVLNHEGTTIPQSWFDHDAEGNRTWLIQGNDLATWWRLK